MKYKIQQFSDMVDFNTNDVARLIHKGIIKAITMPGDKTSRWRPYYLIDESQLKIVRSLKPKKKSKYLKNLICGVQYRNDLIGNACSSANYYPADVSQF